MLSVFFREAMMALSISFWSFDLASGNESFSLGFPSEKNSASADFAPLTAAFAK
jgi:hypothetical protein